MPKNTGSWRSHTITNFQIVFPSLTAAEKPPSKKKKTQKTFLQSRKQHILPSVYSLPYKNKTVKKGWAKTRLSEVSVPSVTSQRACLCFSPNFLQVATKQRKWRRDVSPLLGVHWQVTPMGGAGGVQNTQPLHFTLFRQDGAEISMAPWKHLSADAGWCCAERSAVSAARYDPRPRDESRRHVVLQEKAFWAGRRQKVSPVIPWSYAYVRQHCSYLFKGEGGENTISVLRIF